MRDAGFVLDGSALARSAAIVRCPDPARYDDGAVLDACAVILSGTRVGVERDMAAQLQRAILAGRGV